MSMWMVRAGQGGAWADLFVEESCVGVDFWSESFQAPPTALTREELAAALQKAQPELSKGKLIVAAGQFYRFLHDLAPGDQVITYDPNRRVYYLGELKDRAAWAAKRGAPLPTRKGVRWTGKVVRDSLSVSTRNTLGSIMTLFLINDEAADEVRGLALPMDAPEEQAPTPAPSITPDATTNEDLRWEQVEKSNEFIEDRIAKLGPYELQDLVAGILRAMGYKTRVSPPGADRGVDIFASPDGLGLQEPRIFVEVKHRLKSAMGSSELRAFLGGRKPTDRCLYVSTGGFTKDASYEADRAAVPLTLIDLPRLRELLLSHYEALDQETRQLVPLTRLYWPIERDE